MIVGLIVLVLVVFSRAVIADFVRFDDRAYVVNNPNVNSGLGRDNVIWAFTNSYLSNWHPLTWVSHMLDCELFGLEPGGHHAVSVLIHAANTALLFWVLRRLTGEFWPSAAVAALWAVHPLRIESVAWVAERKDVLSGLFFLLTIAAYSGYVRVPSKLRYGLVLLTFACGLMAKSMLVTTPFVLLLLDYWPLKRLGPTSSRRMLRNVLLEKLPLLALSMFCCIITLSTQTDAMTWGAANLTFEGRVANALVSYVVYLMQFFFPFNLAALYPHPVAGLPTWQVAGSAILLIAITAGTLRALRSAPYLAVGWFWFLGMLVPVIGLVQVGAQAHADRYTYLPYIGLIWSIVWVGKSVGTVRWNSAICIGAILALMVVSWRQVGVWSDSVQLFTHTIECTAPNRTAHNNLGVEYKTRGLDAKAAEHFRLAIEIDPAYESAHFNLGLLLSEFGQYEEAIAHLQKVIELDTYLIREAKEAMAVAYSRMGIRLVREQRFREAIDSFQQALAIDPGEKAIRRNLARACFEYGLKHHQSGQLNEAVLLYKQAIASDSNLNVAYNNLGVALRELKQFEEAAAYFRIAVELEPGNQLARKNLQDVLHKIRP